MRLAVEQADGLVVEEAAGERDAAGERGIGVAVGDDLRVGDRASAGRRGVRVRGLAARAGARAALLADTTVGAVVVVQEDFLE
ncbi:MAG: hypothetical protein ABR992_07225 [Solirubrobacteraceae bacterium]